MSGLVLMENAGRGVADVMCDLGIDGPVFIACARGNNGGDGFVLARHLDLRDHDVHVLLCCDAKDLLGDAAINHAILTKTDVTLYHWSEPSYEDMLSQADWVVDALLGTGARGDPRPPMDRVIRQLNDVEARRLAIDVPSGLECDSGQLGSPTFRADHTCTLVAAKPGLLQPEAASHVGTLHVLDIGVPRKLWAGIGST
jgi:NAD(P)H-hydrate epimerase